MKNLQKKFQSWGLPIEKLSYEKLTKERNKRPVSEPPVPLTEGCNRLRPKVNQWIMHHDLSVIHTYF
jgi:hypothetical protein